VIPAGDRARTSYKNVIPKILKLQIDYTGYRCIQNNGKTREEIE
jgi:hypothetical protein